VKTLPLISTWSSLMETIGDVIVRDLSKPIEEIIKLDQRDEETVRAEITEYVATKNIKEQYLDILKAIGDSKGEPTEAVGVWVSGFFGSGKSSFAKNLGYILENPKLAGTPAAKLFMNQLRQQSPGDPLVDEIQDRLDFCNASIKAHVIMFDVRLDAAVRRTTEPLAEIMYTVLLRELDYAQDFDIAALEIELEGEKALAKFVKTSAELYREQVRADHEAETSIPVTLKGVAAADWRVWQQVRKGAQRIQRTSTILHEMNPKTFPNKESWAQTIKASADITVRDLVSRTFELAARRRPGHTIIYVIDEVGGYVASSAEKLENLRALVEHFGQEGRNRVAAHQAVAPVWVIVTSQEKLDEVVAAINDKRVELARVQDRFRHRVDMAPADIRVVATKRILGKKAEAIPVLREMYQKSKGQLATHTQPERSTKINFSVDEEDFVQFYPYLPHFIELSIDIISGLRLQPGAPRHYGGSNRTIIKQAYEMLASRQTHLAKEKLGTLVTLDRIYDLLYSNLPSERQKDMLDIETKWKNDPWIIKTAKAICLLEYTRGLLRSERTIAAVLYESVDAPSPLVEVTRAIEELEKNQFIRQAEEGWKLLTAQEKSWTSERLGYSPSLKERNDIWEEILKEIFQEPALNRYSFKRRNFALNVSWQGRLLTSKGQIPLELKLSDDSSKLAADGEAVRIASREAENRKRLYWVFAATDEIDNKVEEIYRSRRMVGKYDPLRAQNKLQQDEIASLAAEKQIALKLQEQCKALVIKQIERGVGFLDGFQLLGPELGESAQEIIDSLLDYAMPKLYPEIDLGARPVTGDEAQEILKAANLNGLSTIFYAGNDGLELVVQEHGKLIINDTAPVAKAILGYIQSEHSYGNKVTGRMLEDHFGEMPYGWDREILWIVLASLLRKGTVEVTYQGRRFRNHLDPQVRPVFAGSNAFRTASFAPRKAPDLQTLVAAAKRYEEITGDEVDVDENAIAQAFQKLATTECDTLVSLEAIAKANSIPVLDTLTEYRSQLNAIVHSASDDAVNILAGEGASFKEMRQQVQEIRRAIDGAGLAKLQRARNAFDHLLPTLVQHAADAGLQERAAQVVKVLGSPTYFRHSAEITQITAEIEQAYETLYRARHTERAKAYGSAIDMIKGLPDWPALAPAAQDNPESRESETQKAILAPLAARACDALELAGGATSCANCGASIPEMESDLLAVNSLRDQAIYRLQEYARPQEKIQRVRVAEVVNAYTTLSTKEEVDELIKVLHEHLLKLVESGIKIVLE
jgi:hypothetical protein